jgi:PAS domain S-box-containing protein
LKPNLIMTDIRLPSGRGRIKTGELIHSIYDIPIIYILNGDDRDALQRAKLSTPWGIIFVPYDNWQLIGAIETALQRHQLESELRNNRKWLNTTLISIGEGVIATDAEGRVQVINPTAQRLLGWTQTDALGMPFQKIFTLVDEQEAEYSETDSIQKTTGLRIGKDVEGILISKTGRHMPVGVNATLINDDRGRSLGTVLVFRDLTKQKASLAEIRRQALRAETLVEAASQLNKQLELETVLNKICVITNEALKAVATAVFLREPKKEFFKSMATYSNIPSLQQYNADSYRLPSEILENLLSVEHPVSFIPDMQAYPDWPHLDLARMEGIHALILTALIRQGEIVGALISVVPSGQYTLQADDRELLRGLADQASSAIENSELFEQVRMGRERQRKLAKNLVNIQEAERRTIAQDLHDHLGQVLTGLQFMLEGVKGQVPDEQKGELGEIQKVVSDVIEQIREMSLNLRPSMLDDKGLIPTLQWHFKRYTGQTGIEVIFQYDEITQRLPAEIETAAYRIVQEALTNVARYAQTKDVFVGLARHEDDLWLEIVDKGKGFDTNSMPERPSSGLGGMRERASLAGGYLVVESYLNQGTQIVAALPLSSRPLERRKYDRKNPAG